MKFNIYKLYASFTFALFLLVIAYPVNTLAADPTPQFTFSPSMGETQFYETVDNSTIEGSATVTNVDPTRWIEIEMEADPRGPMPINFSADPAQVIDPSNSYEFNFTVEVPEGSCEDTYPVALNAILIDYDGLASSSDTGVGNKSGIGYKIYITVDSNIPCLEEGDRQVFHDLDGDDVMDPEDVAVVNGYAYLYDDTDTLIHTTDLSTTGGVYETPEASFVGPKDFYLVVDTGKFDGSDLDTTWYENVFVNRTGSYSGLGSTIFFDDVNDYSEILSSVPLRSRNTDQSGDWSLNTLSIGPDDKDQVISPIRWDYLTDGTEFKYADLDYDGRIDPDDKDHIISPLYWDFPN